MKILNALGNFIGKVIVLLVTVGIVGSVFARLGLVRSTSSDAAPTQSAVDTTGRNSFVSGCKNQNVTEQECGCAYDKLKSMYPDLDINQDRIHRILTTGYTTTETDAMVTCYIPTQVN